MMDQGKAFSREGLEDFRFVEKSSSHIEERRIVPVDKPQPIDVQKAAKQFVALATADRKWAIREPETMFFNRLVRAARSKHILVPSKFFTELKHEVVKIAGPLRDPVEMKGEKLDITQAVEWCALGVEAILEAISELQLQFHKQVRPAERKQLIGTNDLLDALHKIDLVELQYQTHEEKIDVRLVRFIQVKRGGKPLTKDERQNIHHAHAQYLSKMSPFSSMALARKKEAEQFILQGRYFHQEVDTRMDDADLRTFFDNYFEPFMLELFSGPDEPDDESIEAMLRLTASSIHPTVAKVFFHEPHAMEFFIHFAISIGEQEQRAQKLLGILQEWIVRHAPSTTGLRSLNPAWHEDPELIPLMRFESAIMEGNHLIAEPLTLENSRVLTRKKK